MTKKFGIILTKSAITAWGLLSAFQGIMRDAVSNERAPYAHLESTFVGLVYFSVLVGGLFAFVSARAVSAVLLLVSVIALGIYVLTAPSSDGLGLGAYHSSLLAIALRPLLVSLVLFVVSRYEINSPN